ncbi:putative surface layer protein [Oscillibacter valericigenes Sjm18-20]|nr:putative surface layer protein [Oscillibacter valericigenes Sjm18-20]
MAKMIRKKFIAVILTLAMMLSLMPALTLTASAATNATFDFEDHVTGLGTHTVQQTNSGETLIVNATDYKLVDAVSYTSGEALSGLVSISTDFGTTGGFESCLSFSVSGSKTFDLISLKLKNYDGDTETIVLTSSKGNATFSVDGDSTALLNVAAHANAAFFEQITWFSITEDTADETENGYALVFDDIALNNITTPGPALTSAIYDANTNVLAVTGTGMTIDDTIAVSKLTLTGEGGKTYTLTSSDVTATSGTEFSVTLNAADQLNVEGLLNKNGTSSADSTTYNIAGAAGWDTTQSTSDDTNGNGITVYNVQTPTITSATYDAATAVLTVTGTNMVKQSGATNDIEVSMLTLTGEGGETYTLTSSNIEITSGTSFTVTLNPIDKAAVNQILNKNGTSSTGNTTYNLAAADDWNGPITGGDTADATGNGITVSGVNNVPTLTTIGTLTGATEDTAYTISYTGLVAASDAADGDSDPISFRIEAVSSGTLTKDSAAVTAGQTTLASGESLVWTPAANANGDLDAFTVKAYDGTDASNTAVQVKVTVTAVNDNPTGTPTVSGTAAVGETLTASTSGISDADGLGTFSYQWQVSDDGSSGWANIASNSTSSTYDVTSDEAGKYVRVAVSYTDGGSTAETVYSDAFGPNKTSQAALVYDDVTKTYGDAAFTYAATGGSGGGAVTYASSDTTVATIDSSTGEVTILKAGSTTLTVTKAGDATYTEAAKSCTLTVNKAALTATVGDDSKTYGDANPAFTVDVTGFVNGDTAGTAGGYSAPTASCSADATTDAGTATITISGGAATNYTFDTADTGTLTIHPTTLTYTVAAENKEYNGTTDGNGTVSLVGVINIDTVTASGTFTFADDANAGTGKTVNVTGITLADTDKDNYILSTTSATTTANITAKSVTVATVTISDKTYDGTTDATISSASLNGVIGDDDVSVDYTSATATYEDANVSGGKTVNVTGLALAGVAKDNYSLASGSFTTTGKIVNAGTVLAPTASTATGAVLPGTSVTLSCATTGATIYYTTDDSTPTTSSTQYTGAITVDAPVTVKAIAVKTGMNDSSIMSEAYTITSTVTAHDSAELVTYMASTYVSTINLVSGTTYDYNGASITRTLTINGNGATINVGTGIDGTLVKMTSGAVPDVTGKVFFEIGTGGSLTMKNLTLNDDATRILSVFNVKTGGTLSLDGVVITGFFANLSTDAYPASSNIPGSYNNFGVHAEPEAVSTTVTNCTFGSSNSFRNTIAIRGGAAAITNNTFAGTANENRQNQTDGNEYAVYLYGGTSTVTGNNMSGYDSRLALNYLSSAISIAPYYAVTTTITGNTIHDNTCGINPSGSWHTLSYPAVATVNGTALTSSANAHIIGQALITQNTLSGNTQGGVQLVMDQNDYFIDINNSKEYGTPAYCSDFISLKSKTSSSATLTFGTFDSAMSLIANQKSFILQVSEDNGASWTTATTSAALGTTSTGATVTLTPGKTYLLRAALTISSVVRAHGSAELPVVYADIVCYSNTVSATITAASSGDDGSTSSGSGGAAVIVNGETKTAGMSKTTTNSDGKKQTTVTVDTKKLEEILKFEGSGATVIIPVTGGSAVAAGVLTGEMVKNMENKEATLVVQTDSGSYTLPASEIDINAVSEELGIDVSLSDIKVTVSISEPSASMTQVVENAAHDGGFAIMVPAVDYTITCTHGSQTVSVSSFNAYVERTIAIPDGVDPTKITTGVVVDPDGTTHHVPTRVELIGGKYYAVINSLTNSTYSVIWNSVEFSDVAGHWAKDAINNMGSRMVVTGVGNNNYAPDKNMTRAEFAAIMVRALGLEPGTGASGFGDVAAADWYSGYIKTAASYGIIKGYDNGNFGPNDTIKREQAMTMIARAMKITGLTVTLTDSDVSALIGVYTDGASASDYAEDSIAACLKTGITSGTGNATISPKADITRAEVAVMVQRLLQKSGLI